MKNYRSLFLSDLHLGSRSADVGRLMLFLEDARADTLYLVGDIVDGVAPADAVRALRDAADRVIYVYGNHDFLGTLGGLASVDHVFHETASGRRLLVTHGDRFDPLMGGWRVVLSGFQHNLLWRFVYKRFTRAARATALGQGCSGIVCGHLHHAEIHQERGFLYVNCGDFVSSLTAVAEHADGHLELLYG